MAAEPVPELPVDAIGYIRVSLLREEAISPETQQASIEDWARRNGRRIVAWITDLDKTGRNFRRRIMTAIGQVQDGDAREIVVWKFSRFGRDRAGVAVNLAVLEKAGGRLVSATEDVDSGTATGRFARGMLFEVAAFESDRAAETWAETDAHRIREGLPPKGRPRFGYERLGRLPDPVNRGVTRRDMADPAGERYVPSAETGPLLAGMYRRYLGGDSARGIAQWLNGLGSRTTVGHCWEVRTVLRVMDSGFGAGWLNIHGAGCRCEDSRRCPRREWVRGRQEPVISEQTWQEYLARRGEVQATPPRQRRAVYPVSGLCSCGHCGAGMAAHGGGSYFACVGYRNGAGCPARPTIPVAFLLDAVRAELGRWAADLDAAAALDAGRAQVLTAGRDAAERIARDLAAADRVLARLLVQRAEDEDGKLDSAAWDIAVADQRAKRGRLEADLGAAKRSAATASRDVIPVMPGILAGWDLMPPARLRDMLRQLIRVQVWRLGEPGERPRGPGGRYVPLPREAFRIKVIPVWESSTL